MSRRGMSNDKKIGKSAIILLIGLIVVTAVVFCVYRLLMNIQSVNFEYVLIAYMVAEAILVAVYLIYNRGFSRRGITKDMLPMDWSDEKKEEFIQSGKERVIKSRWMLIFIFAFIFTFAVDIIELTVIPSIMEMFK